MKIIYVTVAEFLENGGILTQDRDIYQDEDGNWEGKYVSYSNDPDLIVVWDYRRQSVVSKHTYFVQVNVTPIYI